MRRLELPVIDSVTLMHRFLISQEGDVKEAMGQLVPEADTHAYNVYGQNQLPTTYPYVLIGYVDKENGFIDLTFVAPADFS